MNLRPKSLNDFGPNGWWAIADTLVDRGRSGAPMSALTMAVRERALDGDLRRADTWLGEDAGDFDRGAILLTNKMIEDLAHAGIVEYADEDVVRFTRIYLDAHRLSGGGVRMVWAGGATYDALPAADREARHRADTERANTSAAIQYASRYRREVKTPEERGEKFKTSRQAAEELFESLRSFGYLEAFPVTVNRDGQVTEGNHRLAFAELARQSLVDERGRIASNGSDPIALADLDRRIASLARENILAHAVHPGGRPADDVKVMVASQIQIPWLAHERRQLAKRLHVDGYDVAAIAQMLGASERSVREWTQDDRAATQAERDATVNAEIERLVDLGWSLREIAQRLGVSKSHVDRRAKEVSHDGVAAVAGQSDPAPAQGGRKVRITDDELAREADRFYAEGGTAAKVLAAQLREQGRGTAQQRIDTAWRLARERADAERQRKHLTGAKPAPPSQAEAGPQCCPTCGRPWNGANR
jgi:transposase